jgi:hypothetical protein
VVVIVPVLMAVILVVVQAAVLFHAANVAAAAASQGAAAGAARGATAGDSAAVARTTVSDLGGRLGSPPAVHVDASTVVVTVEVRVPRIAPFFPSEVRRSALEPRERFMVVEDR